MEGLNVELFFTMVVPLTITGVALYGLGRGVDVYDALVQEPVGDWRFCCGSFPL